MNKIRALGIAITFIAGCSPAFAKVTEAKSVNGKTVITTTLDPAERDAEIQAHKNELAVHLIRKEAFHQDAIRSQNNEADEDSAIAEIQKLITNLESAK